MYISGMKVFQATRTASAKALRQHKFGMFREKQGSHCGNSLAKRSIIRR